MEPVEIEETKSTSVTCSGRDVPYDHPRVFLEIDPDLGKIDCPYCGKRFKLES
jgi:uncharacterized Zn-finger protein